MKKSLLLSLLLILIAVVSSNKITVDSVILENKGPVNYLCVKFCENNDIRHLYVFIEKAGALCILQEIVVDEKEMLSEMHIPIGKGPVDLVIVGFSIDESAVPDIRRETSQYFSSNEYSVLIDLR